MKEALGDFADGQIEFYRAVSGRESPASPVARERWRWRYENFCTLCLRGLTLTRIAGYGRVGTDYTHHATYTGGCLMEGIGRDSLVEEGWRTRGREAVRAAVLYTTLLKLPV